MQPSKVQLRSSFHSMSSGMKNQLSKSMGIKNDRQYAEAFHGASKEKMTHILRENKVAESARSGIIAHATGQATGAASRVEKSAQIELRRTGEHTMAEMIQKSVESDIYGRAQMNKMSSDDRDKFNRIVRTEKARQEKIKSRNLQMNVLNEAKKQEEMLKSGLGDPLANYNTGLAGGQYGKNSASSANSSQIDKSSGSKIKQSNTNTAGKFHEPPAMAI